MKKLWRFCNVCLTSLFIVVMLTSCGFQLRGTLKVAPDLIPIYVGVVEGSSIIADLLKEKLRLNAIPLTDDPKAAKLTVRILKEKVTKGVSSVDRRGKSVGSEIYYHVEFEAIRADGSNLLEPQSIKASREYVDPVAEVLGKTEEATLIKSDLENDIADRIVSQLRTRLQP